MHRVTAVTMRKLFNHKALKAAVSLPHISPVRRGTELPRPRLSPTQGLVLPGALHVFPPFGAEGATRHGWRSLCFCARGRERSRDIG